MNEQRLGIEYIIGKGYDSADDCLTHFKNKISDDYVVDGDIEEEWLVPDKVLVLKAKLVPNLETKNADA